jgi:O-antigen/teichoic acid export membrane protein
VADLELELELEAAEVSQVQARAEEHPSESITRNTVFGAATQITTAAFTAALTLYLVRALGPDDYGVFALAVSIGTVLMLASDFGITGSAGRFIAEMRGDRGGVSAVVSDSTLLKLAVVLPFCIGLFALAGPIANAYGNQALLWPLRGMAFAVLGQSMFLLYRGVFVSLGRVSVTWRATLLESAIEASASIALVLAGAGAAGAAFGRATGYLIGSLLAAGLAVRLLGRDAVGTRSRGYMGKVARYGTALLVVTVAFTLFEQVDVLLIGAIIGTKAVGVFEAPMRLATFLGYAGQAVAFGVAPRLARSKDEGPNVAAFATATRYLTILQGALLAPLLVWTTPIVDLALGSGYEGSVSVLRALTPFVFLAGLGTFITLAVNYIGEARRRIVLSVVTVALNAAIDLVLLSRIGVVGGAIGTDVAFGLYVAGHFWICKQVMDLSLAPVAVTFARCLLAAAAMAGVLALFGTSSLSWFDWIAGAVSGLLTYLVALVATGELSRTELGQARAAVAARLASR